MFAKQRAEGRYCSRDDDDVVFDADPDLEADEVPGEVFGWVEVADLDAFC